MKNKHIAFKYFSKYFWFEACYIDYSFADSRYSAIDKWHMAKLDIPGEWRRFVIEATRGGRTIDQDQCDMAVDDVMLELNRCSGKYMLRLFTRFLFVL